MSNKLDNFNRVWENSRKSFHKPTLETGEFSNEYYLAMDVFDEYHKIVRSVISRLESYPSDMSCYVTQEEMLAGKALKEGLIRILKEELL